MPEIRTPLTEMLGCRHPVVQTAMGWVADAKLVAATTNAGGFGFLAAATMSTSELDAALSELRESCDGPFGVNFHMFQPNAQEVIERVLANADRVRAVSYGRGPNAETIGRFKQAGVLCMPTVGALKHAVKAVELGADIITVQGGEGGGHTGSTPTTLLLPQVLKAVNVPVVAAGGFHDGRGLAAALAWGAAGIAMGTRFLMTAESPVPRSTLAKYQEVQDAARIRASTAVDGMPQRMIDNPYLEKLEGGSGLRRLFVALASAWRWKQRTGMSVLHMLRTFIAAMRSGDSITQTLSAANAPVLIQRAMVEGHPDEGVLPSGQVASVLDDLPPVVELIDHIMAEATARIDAMPRPQGATAATNKQGDAA
ncbi:NAD(P)H-dependent flavin oxidoreductase [Algiphilus aromaticivorans]|jgi:nitronate monooxygenase|uniref:NAD(P)H-dependent flavin oxidoreductase n=1 Tax=Algiphilus aromaticivorans TaxID=382454 RepID=UPI0005C1B8EC|nr:nitronate monooxygenase [Algiphilus aromaticivorans]